MKHTLTGTLDWPKDIVIEVSEVSENDYSTKVRYLVDMAEGSHLQAQLDRIEAKLDQLLGTNTE